MNTVHGLTRFLVLGALLTVSGSLFAADVGVSISVGQPGFYGRIDVGDYPYPPPRVIYDRPIVVHHYSDDYEPIYLRVPPGHAKNWSRFCGRYDACDRPVYFVQDNWYHDEFVPAYRERHNDDRYDDRRGRGRGRGRGER
jgi:hypothetical protein